MARRTRKSAALTQARIRHDRLKAVDPAMDLGNDLSLTKYDEAIVAGETALSTYNQHLAAGDDLLNVLEKAEAAVAEYSSRMLAAVAAHHGKDSNAYEQAGGTRTSERKKPRRNGGTGNGEGTSGPSGAPQAA